MLIPSTETLSYTGDLVRQYDYDRFLTSLFAPESARTRLHVLYAFNTEIARIRETVTEPLIGQMRLQWWRDVIDIVKQGEPVPTGHPVAEPLAELIKGQNLSFAHFETLLNAREQDMAEEPIESFEDLIIYCRDTSSSLSLLALECLRISDAATVETAQHLGVAWALTGIARSVRHYALAGRIILPADVMSGTSLSIQDLQSPDAVQKVAPAIARVSQSAREHLQAAQDLKKSVDLRAMPVLLQSVLAEQYLDQLERYEFNLFNPKIKTARPGIIRLWWKAWRKDF